MKASFDFFLVVVEILKSEFYWVTFLPTNGHAAFDNSEPISIEVRAHTASELSNSMNQQF